MMALAQSTSDEDIPQSTKGALRGEAGLKCKGRLFKLKPRDVVMLVDAYDVLLTPSAAHAARRFQKLFLPRAPIAFAAERTLWPDAALEAAYPAYPPPKPRGADASGEGGNGEPSSSHHPPRFLNCGTVVGEAWALRLMLRTLRSKSYGATTLCGPDDQRGFHRFWLENRALGTLDYDGAVFQTLHFLREPLHVDATGQILVGAGSPTGRQGEHEAGGVAREEEEEEEEEEVEAWRQRPCAVHGNGGDGKPAYARLVTGWSQALSSHDLKHTPSSSSMTGLKERSGDANTDVKKVRVEPPPFSSGIALYLAGDLRGAEAAFRGALTGDGARLEPSQLLESTFNLGVVCGEVGKLGDARSAYEAALALDPSHQGSLLNLAALWYSEHQALSLALTAPRHVPAGERHTQRKADKGGGSELLGLAAGLVERALEANPGSGDAQALRRAIAHADHAGP